MYEPELLNVGIVLAPLPAVQALLKQRLERVIKSDVVHSARETIAWQQFFEQGGQLYDMARVQIALFAPREDVTVYVCNLADGWVTLFGNLSNAGQLDAYLFRATLAEEAPYKVFEMQKWAHGAAVRQLRALQGEDGWTFLDKGEPLPFENPMQYQKRQINARVDRRTIERYSEAAGYRVSGVPEFKGECWRFWRGPRTAP
jgi:hypothetical protein